MKILFAYNLFRIQKAVDRRQEMSSASCLLPPAFWLVMIIFFILSNLLAEEIRPLLIDSDFVDYNGKTITLNGNSTVDHELGKVEAQRITLIPATEGKKLRFAYLKMSDGVKIALQDGGQLSCMEAEIDYQTLTGKFSGGPQQEYVVYTEYLKGRDPKAPTPLEVKSSEMSMRLQRENGQDSSPLVIGQITADKDVSINYNHDFHAMADHGQFERKEPSQDQKEDKNRTGVISLQANAEEGICQISNRNGDLIHANKMSVDTLNHEMQFDAPKGSLFINADEHKGEIDFSCGSMTWNESKDVLILRDQVAVNYKGIGTLTNPDEIQVYRKLVDGRKQVSLIDCLGQTNLNYLDEKKNESHRLTTYKRFILDHQQMRAHLDSPRGINNNVLENLQVHFSDPMGEIYADEVFVSYKEINKKMTPVKLLLKGNVWLLSRTSVDKEDPGKIMQFAMADRVDYDIASKEMLCMADFNKRVLFFDKSNNLQISAPSVKAKRDPQTQKDAIQGIGDVRFSFIEKEFEQMKKRFGGMGYD